MGLDVTWPSRSLLSSWQVETGKAGSWNIGESVVNFSLDFLGAIQLDESHPPNRLHPLLSSKKAWTQTDHTTDI